MIAPHHLRRWAAEDRRRDELVDLRQTRPLTDAERAEEARLEQRLQMRVWREAQRANEKRHASLSTTTEPTKDAA